MRKPLPAILVCSVGLGLATTAIVADVGTTFGLRAEQAVVQGSIAKLQALRSNLEKDPSPDHYNLAYLDWRHSHLLPGKAKKEKRKLLKRAQKHLETLLETDPANPEAHALRGSAIGERITGMWSGMRLGRKAKVSLNRGFELDPDNPRVALQRGISFFFTPKPFGGGLPKAEQELRRALRLFAKEPSGKPWPNWGRLDVLTWLGQTLAKAGRPEEARALFEEALTLEPDFAWVRDELLPALEATQ